MMPIQRVRNLLAIAALAAAASAASPAAAQTAIIVSEENPVSALSSSQVKRVLLGEIRRWNEVSGSRLPVALSDLKGDIARVASFYQTATGLSARRLRTSWMALVFRGEMAATPHTVKTEEEMIAHVRSTANAIGFVDLSFLDPAPEGVRILKVDGKLPGQEGYAYK